MNVLTLPAHNETRARRTDPATSHEAIDADSVTGSLLEVMDLFAEFGPMADHELVANHAGYTYTPQRLRTARSELTNNGVIEFAGIYRLTPSNRRAQVWKLTA